MPSNTTWRDIILLIAGLLLFVGGAVVLAGIYVTARGRPGGA